MIVGVTGGIGSGKSTVCKLFQSLGVPVISADQISRDLLANDKDIQAAVLKKFGSLERAKLRKIIFDSTDAKIWLENLLHPRIKQAIFEFTANNQAPYCIVEIPILVETNMQDLIDRVLTVDCHEELQIERAALRDNYARKDVLAIMANQTNRGNRLANSDDVIDNSKDLANLEDQVRRQHQIYLSLAKNML